MKKLLPIVILLAVVGAFLLLERDQPVLAGLVGIVATSPRLVGGALVVGLVDEEHEVQVRVPAVGAVGDGCDSHAAPRRADLLLNSYVTPSCDV